MLSPTWRPTNPRAFRARLPSAADDDVLLLSGPSYCALLSHSPNLPLTLDPSNTRYFFLYSQSTAELVSGPECTGVSFPGSESSSHETLRRSRETLDEFVSGLERIFAQPERAEWTCAQKVILFSALVQGEAREWVENLARENETQLFAAYNAGRNGLGSDLDDSVEPPRGMALIARLMYDPVLYILRVWPAFVQAFKRHFSLPPNQHSPELTEFDKRHTATARRAPAMPRPTELVAVKSHLEVKEYAMPDFGSFDFVRFTEVLEQGRQRHKKRCAELHKPEPALTPQEEYRYIN